MRKGKLTEMNLMNFMSDKEDTPKCSPIQPDTCPEINNGGACVGYTLVDYGKVLDKESWDMDEGETFWGCADAEQMQFL